MHDTDQWVDLSAVALHEKNIFLAEVEFRRALDHEFFRADAAPDKFQYQRLRWGAFDDLA